MWHDKNIQPKNSSCRFKNNILLYVVSVTNAYVIYQKGMLHCAIFWFKWSPGLEIIENRADSMNENVTKCYLYILGFPEWKKSGGSGVSYVFPEISKYYFEK